MTIHVRDNRGGSWWWAHNAVFDVYGRDLGPYGIAVYCCLCRHAGNDQATWIGQRAIAEEIGCGRTSVQQALAKLRDLRLLQIEEQQDERGQLTNVYTLLPMPDATVQHPRPLHERGGSPREQGRSPGGRGGPGDGGGPLATQAPYQFMKKTHGTRPGLTPDTKEELPRDGNEACLADADHDLARVWSVTLSDLREQIIPTNFARWLSRARLLGLDAGVATVAVPDRVSAEQLSRRFGALVRQALTDACGQPMAVEYRVHAAVAVPDTAQAR